MKNIYKYILSAALIFGATSCDSYFDVKLEQNIPTNEAYESVQDVKNGMIGAYYTLGTYRFLGNYAIAIGDMASDMAVASSSTGHFYYINNYIIDPTDDETTAVWNYGYKLIDRCVRTIQGAEKIEAKADELNLTEDDMDKLSSYKSQCYALRALATFYLTNIFGLPYQPGQTNSQLGVVLLDKEPIQPFEKVYRSTVEESYAQILSDINLAHEYCTEIYTSGTEQFYFNKAAIYALEARVNLYMGNYSKAKEAAQQAIDLRGSGNVSNEMYIKMWNSTAVTDEDIFTITKTDDDNLSANSLNTLYGSYRASISDYVWNSMEDTDIRLELSEYYAYKFQGTPTSQATSNIPVFRKSEMYLIIAECETQLGNIQAAKEAVSYTAKRNTAFVENGSFDYSMIPSMKDELMKFIREERVRELFQEGHRWYDARRWGIKLSSSGKYSNFDVAKFVYPIPADEINAGFMTQQNDGWEDNLPSL
jgi:hypothetical protein